MYCELDGPPSVMARRKNRKPLYVDDRIAITSEAQLKALRALLELDAAKPDDSLVLYTTHADGTRHRRIRPGDTPQTLGLSDFARLWVERAPGKSPPNSPRGGGAAAPPAQSVPVRPLPPPTLPQSAIELPRLPGPGIVGGGFGLRLPAVLPPVGPPAEMLVPPGFGAAPFGAGSPAASQKLWKKLGRLADDVGQLKRRSSSRSPPGEALRRELHAEVHRLKADLALQAQVQVPLAANPASPAYHVRGSASPVSVSEAAEDESSTASEDEYGRVVRRKFDGWLEIWDPGSQRVYYADQATGRSSWTIAGTPFEGAGRAASDGRSGSAGAASSAAKRRRSPSPAGSSPPRPDPGAGEGSRTPSPRRSCAPGDDELLYPSATHPQERRASQQWSTPSRGALSRPLYTPAPDAAPRAVSSSPRGTRSQSRTPSPRSQPKESPRSRSKDDDRILQELMAAVEGRGPPDVVTFQGLGEGGGGAPCGMDQYTLPPARPPADFGQPSSAERREPKRSASEGSDSSSGSSFCVDKYRRLPSPPVLSPPRGPPAELVAVLKANPEASRLPLGMRRILSELKFHDHWYHELVYQSLKSYYYCEVRELEQSCRKERDKEKLWVGRFEGLSTVDDDETFDKGIPCDDVDYAAAQLLVEMGLNPDELLTPMAAPATQRRKYGHGRSTPSRLEGGVAVTGSDGAKSSRCSDEFAADLSRYLAHQPRPPPSPAERSHTDASSSSSFSMATTELGRALAHADVSASYSSSSGCTTLIHPGR
ncbi:hypothetical protein DIPPA_07337 [Diplonema papillatum]|nr:hypothetical protein DIPPA_07337 [Diplonema papillatum]